MTVLALTGGIASGKSTIARQLVEYGAVHIDADQLAREAVAPGSDGLTRIVEQFGPQILTEHGELDRAALSSIVFTDSAALHRLNSIVHPEVRRLAQERISVALSEFEDAIVVYDVPLLVETNASGGWDAVVVAEAPSEIRVQRMLEFRGMTELDARQRIAKQATNEARRAVADVVIDTSGTLDETRNQVATLWNRVKNGEFDRNGTPGGGSAE